MASFIDIPSARISTSRLCLRASGGGWLEAPLHNFTGGSDGAFPNTGIVIGSDYNRSSTFAIADLLIRQPGKPIRPRCSSTPKTESLGQTILLTAAGLIRPSS